MRKEDLSVAALLAEAVGIVVLAGYIVIQIFYGINYHVPVSKLIMNILMVSLVYVGLSLLSNYPERVNSLPAEKCKGKLRVYTLRMLRLEKILFLISLLIPCISDAFGYRIDGAYSLLVIALLVVIALFYEYRIWVIIRNERDKK